MAKEKTLQELIDSLTWYNEVNKLKEILKKLSEIGGGSYTLSELEENEFSLLKDGEIVSTISLENYPQFQDLFSGNSMLNGNYYNIPDTYQYFVWADKYIIDNVLYTTYSEDTITLSEAHPTLDRKDTIVINNNGTFEVLTGTPSINPAEPDIDDETQVKLVSIDVNANTTSPTGVTSEVVYNENLGEPSEYDASSPSTGVDVDSTDNPQNGTKSIKFNNTSSGARVILDNNELVDGTDVSNIIFRVWVEESSNNRQRFWIRCYNTAGADGTGVMINNGQFGYRADVRNQWQTITIPQSVLGINSKYFNQIRIDSRRDGFTGYIDNIIIQSGTVPVNQIIPEYTLVLDDTDLTLLKDGNISSVVDLSGIGGGGGDGVISNVELDGTDLNFTGASGGFNGTVDLSSLGGDFIPLSGTEVGSPVTGDIEIESISLTPKKIFSTNKFIEFNEDEDWLYFSYNNVSNLFLNSSNVTLQGFSGNGVSLSSSGAITNALNVDQFGVSINSNITTKGLFASIYYGANYTDNTYVQKKYVDDALSAFTPSLEIYSESGTLLGGNGEAIIGDIDVSSFPTITGSGIFYGQDFDFGGGGMSNIITNSDSAIFIADMFGAGDLFGFASINVNSAADAVAISGDDISIGDITTNGNGTLINISDTGQSINLFGYNSITSSSYSIAQINAAGNKSFTTKEYVDSVAGGGGYTNEEAQDAVGTILTDSSEIDFTYNDGTPSITASIVAGSIDETKLDTSVNASLDLADSAIQVSDLTSPEDTGTVIDLSKTIGSYYNMSSANTATTYTTTGAVTGGWSKIRINASSEPTVTGATKEVGARFLESTDMYLVIYDNGDSIRYYFTPYTISSALLLTNSTPSSASDTGIAGQIVYDSSYIYICTATDTWKRAAIATW